MAHPLEDLEAAARDGLVGLFSVVDGNHRIPLPPDDENGHALGEVQPVTSMDALALGADHGTQGGQERGATAGVGERCVPARHLGNVRGRAQPEGRQRTVFMLSHYGDCSPRDISAMTGLNESTVRVHLFRAVRKLRGFLGGQS